MYDVAWITLLLALTIGQISHTQAAGLAECPGITLKRMGCFKDKKQPRALPKMLLTDRDPTDKVSSGITIDWKNWDDYLKGFICRCAKSAISEGYNFMGLQFYGECWSGPNPAQYKRHGASSDCITYAYKPCTGGDCIGKKSTNYVYGVQARGSSPTNKPTETETLPTTLPTTPTPTKRPSPSPTGTGTPTRKPEPTLSPTRMLSGLLCQSFVVSLCTRQDTSGMEQPCDLCGLIRNIYTGYPCFRSVEIIGTRLTPTHTITNMLVQFSCVGRHLQVLERVLRDKNVQASCFNCPPKINVVLATPSPCQQPLFSCPMSCQSPMQAPPIPPMPLMSTCHLMPWIPGTGAMVTGTGAMVTGGVAPGVCPQPGCPAICTPRCKKSCCSSRS